MRPMLIFTVGCALLAQATTSSLAADADHGKAIAQRWCSTCHIVQSGQKSARADQAPPFASLAAREGFGPDRLALLLLRPHPNMPKLSLSRIEIADLAAYISTIK